MLRLTRLAFPAVLAFAAVPLLRAAEPKPVELRPAWKKGEKLKYEMTRTQIREVDGQVVRKNASRTPVDVEVLAANDKGYVVRWTFGQTVHDDPMYAELPLVKIMTRLTQGVQVELEVKPDGELAGVRNWKELQQTGKKVQDARFDEMAKAGVPKANIDRMRANTEQMFASQEAVEMAFGRQAALLCLPLAHTYDPAKPTQIDGTLPNQFGGDPFPTKNDLVLKKLDTAGVATVTITQKPDPKEFKKVLEKSLRELAKKQGKQPDDVTVPDMELSEESVFAVEVKTGWVRGVTHTRKVKNGTSISTEITTLTRRKK